MALHIQGGGTWKWGELMQRAIRRKSGSATCEGDFDFECEGEGVGVGVGESESECWCECEGKCERE